MKRFVKIFTIIISLMLFIGVAKAGSLSLSASTNVKVGSAVKVRVNISNLAGRFTVTSSDNSVLAGSADDFWESSQTVIFTAKKVGKATITVKPVNVAGVDDEKAFTSSRSITITVTEGKNQSDTTDINKTYSSNNNLSSLSVEGFDISPKFSKDTKDYSLQLDGTVDKITIHAKAEDENATVRGTGEVAVSEGNNTIKITVIAENGNEKIYTINAEVEDKNPINVKINGKKYTVVKNKSLLTIPEGYKESTIQIDDVKVPAFINEITGNILIGLKDAKGNINLYLYNPANGKYSLYREFTFDSIKLQYLTPKKTPMGYSKYKVEINGQKVTIYKKNRTSDYGLMYAINLDTGDIGWYSYDAKEHTIQRYNDEDINILSFLNNNYLITIVILSIASLMLMLFMMILMIKIRNQKRN